MSRVRWSWLWSRNSDVIWNFAPFWAGFAFVAALYAVRDLGGLTDNPMLNFRLGGRNLHLAGLLVLLYGPLVDAPHIWGTLARTYTDKDEWAARKPLFLGSLALFAVGPVIVLAPYVLRSVFHLGAGHEDVGWDLWSNLFATYALFHINKQHWGFVALYKRKNGDTLDNRIDQIFFHTTLWLPFAAMIVAPWYADFDGKPFAITHAVVGNTTTGALLYHAFRFVFWAMCIGYVAFQIDQYRKGVPRNGPKLAYMATVLPLYYLAFAVHPLIAVFWVITTGTGHCAQYHRVVWAYGKTKYAGKEKSTRRLPGLIFDHVWLYAALGLLFGLVTLQGPGGNGARLAIANVMDGALRHVFAFLDHNAGVALGLQVLAAFITGARLHHFYVDSKIWRVSKSAALAKNLNV